MKLLFTIILVIGSATLAFAQETNAATQAIFKRYDNALIEKVTDRWYEILGSMPSSDSTPAGNVTLEFRLFPDGHISDLKADSSYLQIGLVAPCKKAVTDSAPFPKWTKDMRKAYTNDFRVIHFTFYAYGRTVAPSKPQSKTIEVSNLDIPSD